MSIDTSKLDTLLSAVQSNIDLLESFANACKEIPREISTTDLLDMAVSETGNLYLTMTKVLTEVIQDEYNVTVSVDSLNHTLQLTELDEAFDEETDEE